MGLSITKRKHSGLTKGQCYRDLRAVSCGGGGSGLAGGSSCGGTGWPGGGVGSNTFTGRTHGESGGWKLHVKWPRGFQSP